MSLAAVVTCPHCNFAVHPGLTSLIPGGYGRFIRVCRKCHTDYVALRQGEAQRRAAGEKEPSK